MIISFYFLEQAAHACLEFWYSLAHNGGVTKLTIKEEVGAYTEELRTQSIIWELEATNKESDSQWQVGQVLVNANNLVVIAEKGEKEGGFVAIDDLFFKIDPEFLDHCETMPPSVSTQSKKLNFQTIFRRTQREQPLHLQTQPPLQVQSQTATLIKIHVAGRFFKI